jgi:hypothetical protein
MPTTTLARPANAAAPASGTAAPAQRPATATARTTPGWRGWLDAMSLALSAGAAVDRATSRAEQRRVVSEFAARS